MVSYNDSLNRLLISFTQIIKVKLENDEKKLVSCERFLKDVHL